MKFDRWVVLLIAVSSSLRNECLIHAQAGFYTNLSDFNVFIVYSKGCESQN